MGGGYDSGREIERKMRMRMAALLTRAITTQVARRVISLGHQFLDTAKKREKVALLTTEEAEERYNEPRDAFGHAC